VSVSVFMLVRRRGCRGVDGSARCSWLENGEPSGWERTHALCVGKAAPLARDIVGFSDPVLGGRYRDKWSLTNAMTVDSLTADHDKHGGFDVGLQSSCESEPIPTSLVDGEREPALGHGPSSRPAFRAALVRPWKT
jgi:hypothetical protein